MTQIDEIWCDYDDMWGRSVFLGGDASPPPIPRWLGLIFPDYWAEVVDDGALYKFTLYLLTYLLTYWDAVPTLKRFDIATKFGVMGSSVFFGRHTRSLPKGAKPLVSEFL